MILSDKHKIQIRPRALTRQNFQSCCNLIDYLNDRGLTDAIELVGNENILKESCFSDGELNLFMSYFVFDEFPLHSKNQVYLSELIIHLFYKNGLDLMKATEVRDFFMISATYFPGCFPTFERKILGSIIRKSKKLIAYKQGGYVLKNDVEHCWCRKDLKKLQEKIREELKTKDEIDPKLFFKEHQDVLQFSQINNSHYMFSVLKELNTDDEIIYYRNTFNSKIRRRKRK